MIDVGSTLQLMHSNVAATLVRPLGEGAQGRVFAATVETDEGAGEYALKWYRTGFATAGQRATLESLVQRGTPGESFLWPIDLASAPGERSFGYLMPLRPAHFVAMADLLNGRCDPPLGVMLKVGDGLAASFLVLHAAGLCYRDINLGNVFFDPSTGAVMVCDLDNVGIDGEGGAEIGGSPFFSAPEVVTGQQGADIASDRFSLAVLLFLLLMLHHPLEGARAQQYDVWDVDAERALFGAEPVFVFDPDDESNRPIDGVHGNVLEFWPRFPPFLRGLFTTAFTDGLTDRGARVTEGAWRRAMRRLADAVLVCDRCQADVFFDEQSKSARCWSCGHVLTIPPRLGFDDGMGVFLTAGTVVTEHHVDRTFGDGIVADVTTHPDDTTIMGLRNRTAEPWRVRLGATDPTDLPPGRSIAVVDGLEIEFSPQRTAHVALTTRSFADD